jgi:hypothetical protein
MRGAPQKRFAKLIWRISCRTSRATLGLPGRRRDFQRQKVRSPARCHRTIVSGRTIITASRTVGASRYSNTKIERSKDVRAGRLGVLRRSTFNWCRSAITSPSSALLDRKRSRRIHLSRLKGSSTRRSSPDSGAQAKRMKFAAGSGHVRPSGRSSRTAVAAMPRSSGNMPRARWLGPEAFAGRGNGRSHSWNATPLRAAPCLLKCPCGPHDPIDWRQRR